MKKYFLKTLLLVLCVTVTSCTNENLGSQENDQENVLKSTGNSWNDIYNYNGILVFPSIERFVEVQNILNDQIEAAENAFLDQYSEYDDEALNEIEEEIGYNDNQPLIDFEQSFGFSSLRDHIATLEADWLQNDELDNATDPDNHFIVDEVVRTFLNVAAEVKIGSSIFIFRDGYTIEILDCNFDLLEIIRDMPTLEQVLEIEEGVNVVDTGMKRLKVDVSTIDVNQDTNIDIPDCETANMKRNSDKVTSGNRRIKWVLSVWYHPWADGAIAKTKAYKKKRRRGWKKYRTRISARVYGDLVNHWGGNCDIESVDDHKSKRARKVKTKRVGKISTTKSGYIKGEHTGPNGIHHHTVLTW